MKRPPLILIALLLAAALMPRALLGADLEVTPPSEGDIIFYSDVVTFYSGEGLNTEEVYCVVPNEQIEFVEYEGGFRGDLQYTVVFYDLDGREVARSEKLVEVFADTESEAGDRNVIQVFQSDLEVEPGEYEVKITFEDQNALKREIVAYLLKKKNTGEAEFEVISREFERGKLSLSDIEFARSLSRKASGVFEKSGYEVVPNPSRRYGLLVKELAFYFEVYDLTEQGVGDSLDTVISIITRTGDTIFTERKTVAMGSWKNPNVAIIDISSLAAGTYLLKVEALDGRGGTIAYTQAMFDVAWSVLTWGKYRREIIDDMRYIMTEDELADLNSLSTGDLEKRLTEFWQQLDPTPGTLENEALEEHYRRVNFADLNYGASGQRGALTDMGRLYIKYGPPDDIQSHYSDYEFVQGTRDMAGGSEPALTDPFSRTFMKAGAPGSEDYTRTSSETDEHLDQRGGETVHGKAYEIWTYEGPGNPVRRLAKRSSSQASVRFIFADETGNGNYRLIYSTEKHEH